MANFFEFLNNLRGFFLKDNDIISYYAVFDGHVTHHAATYCSEHLHQHIVESKYYPHKLEEAMYYALQKTDKMFAEKCLKQVSHFGYGCDNFCILILTVSVMKGNFKCYSRKFKVFTY